MHETGGIEQVSVEDVPAADDDADHSANFWRIEFPVTHWTSIKTSRRLRFWTTASLEAIIGYNVLRMKINVL